MSLNASNQGVRKVAQISYPGLTNEVEVLNADGNNLSSLAGLERYPALIQLSVCDNNLVRMEAVQSHTNLVTLNLQGNSITEIAGLEGLVNLQWLSLAANTISVMNGIKYCVKLNHLDLSENCITELSDITPLHSLKTLLLHSNAISSLQRVPHCLPKSLATLSLAENEISDLNEASFLHNFCHLKLLSLLGNPCVSVTESRMFDYRPYILFWCPSLSTLDGMEVMSDEKHSSQMLFPPKKPYPFALGEHNVLIHYLSSVHPLSNITIPSPGPAVRTSLKTDSLDSSARTSLSELEELLTKSASMNQSGLVQKLRALQLVEEMITVQEQRMGINGSGDRVDERSDKVAKEGVVVTHLHHQHHRSPVNSFMQDQGQLESKRDSFDCSSDHDETFPGSKHETKPATLSQVGSSVSKSLEDRRQEQLRLINEKIAKRHSKLPRKDPGAQTTKTSAILSVAAIQKKQAHLLKEQGLKDEGSIKVNDQELKAAEQVGGTKKPDQTSVSALRKPALSPNKPTSTRDPLPVHSTSSDQDDLLESESSFLPVPLLPNNDGCIRQSLSDTALLSGQDSSHLNSLLSSLDCAYGYSSLSETSRLLSSLTRLRGGSSEWENAKTNDMLKTELQKVSGGSLLSKGVLSPDFEKEATRIQAAYRGYSARKKYRSHLRQSKAASLIQATWRGYIARRRDSQILQVRAEISRIKLEAYVSTLHNDMQKCKQKMAHQAHLVQLQEETIQTLLHEVKGLKLWKDETVARERREAALVLQKYWRGYRVRKSCVCSGQLISHKQSLLKFCASLQKQVEQLRSVLEGMSKDHGSQRDISTSPRSDMITTDLPCPSELQMTHYSKTCILLRWTAPPALPPNSSSSLSPRPSPGPKRLGYRVYVNGVPEGMVGPDKLKAYIEGLDKDITYRIIVRTVYNVGESRDSNPVIASLDSVPVLSPSSTDRLQSNDTGSEKSESDSSLSKRAGSDGTYDQPDVFGAQFEQLPTENTSSDIQEHTIRDPSANLLSQPTEIHDTHPSQPNNLSDSTHQQPNDQVPPSSGRENINSSPVYKVSHITHDMLSMTSSDVSPLSRDKEMKQAFESHTLESSDSELCESEPRDGANSSVREPDLSSDSHTKGDLGEYGYVKPSSNKPTQENTSTTETTATSQFPKISPNNTSVQPVASMPPQMNAGILTSPLISGAISPPLFIPLVPSDGSCDLALTGVQSVLFDEPLTSRTKQSPPFSSVVASSFQTHQQLMTKPTSFAGVELAIDQEINRGNVKHTLSQVSPPQSRNHDSVGNTLTLDDTSSREASKQSHSTRDNIAQGQTLDQKGDSTLGSGVQKEPGECKQQVIQLPSNCEKCFDAGCLDSKLPKESSDSIKSLPETAITSVATLADETRASSVVTPNKISPLAVLMPLINEGGEGEIQKTGHVVETMDIDQGNSSLVASALLSKLELDLTNSLNEDSNNT